MARSESIIALDVGEKRIGVALADTSLKIAIAYDTIEVDGSEHQEIAQLIDDENARVVVVGYPRNQSGEPTAQTAYVEQFASKVEAYAPTIVFQDESLTSVHAEELLKKSGKPYRKGDIDSLAASLILQDYLEIHS